MPDSGGHEPAEGGERREAKVLFGKYEVGRLLGCGAFGKVYHARNTRSGQSVAIKCISKQRITKSGLMSNITREISIMRLLRHPHIVRLIEVLASRSKIYFVMELVKGGELFTRLARGRLPEDLSRRYFQQLICAVGFCHARGVFHRDLKPENILLDENGDLKVSDFGLSAVADQIRHDGLFHTLCGTPAYVAPEILSRKGYDGAKVDLWSCGVILFVLNAGYLPFNDPNLMAMYRKIYRGEYRCPRWTSPELKRLISRLLDTDPKTRITVDGIVHDPWFRKGLKEERWTEMTRLHGEAEEKISKAVELDLEEDRELNAFDIISFSSGFDLSGLFDDVSNRERFVSGEPAEKILGRVEELGRGDGMVVTRREGKKKGRGVVAVEGQNGNLVACVQVYRLSGELVVVEVERGRADEPLSVVFWKEKLGPALRWPASNPIEPVADQVVVRPVS